MAVAFIVVLCMSANYVVVRHRRDVGMAPAIWLAGVISALARRCRSPIPRRWPGRSCPGCSPSAPASWPAACCSTWPACKRIPAGRAALLGLLELVLGPIWVWLFDGEKPDDLTLLGGAIVIGAAAANVWLDSRRPTG